MIFRLATWIIPIALNVWADRNGRKPHYLLMFILRGMASIIHAVFTTPLSLYSVRDLQNLMTFAPIIVFQATSFWIFFELSLNQINGKPPLYHDIKEKDSGWLDRFFAWTGPVIHGVAKFTALILMIASLFYIL